MRPSDFLIYAVHVAFWGSFGLTRMLVGARGKSQSSSDARAPAAQAEHVAPFSRSLLAFHMFAFGVMYFGIGAAVFPSRVPTRFPGQRIVGACIIALGAALMSWTLVFFRSWRFRAKIEEGHRLATDGPFRLLRHPIYMGLNLLALGTAIWIPTPIVWIGFALMVIGSDLRARSEEVLLARAFGSAYAAYCVRTSRFIPGLY
jgi:protein-S-isoprenylcysteine O-methyltransferase Ste14